jgi:Protein of unknown function (DUF3833)
MTSSMTDFPVSFALEDYFSGPVRAHGVLQDRFGRIRKQFIVDMHGRMDAGVLILHETFRFSDGATSNRTWRIRRTGIDTYEGSADDVVGRAIGQVIGNSIRWRYRLRLKVGRNIRSFDFHDTMLLQGDGLMINRAEMRKFGVRLADMTLVFRKTSTGAVSEPDARLRLVGRH